jgi:ABC-type antimicrobial peptide transport system permease subunit
VRRLIFQEGLWVAALGATIGLAGAMMAARMLRDLLFEVHPLDPPAMAAATLLVIGASAVACYVPAVRASQLDPLVALRRD